MLKYQNIQLLSNKEVRRGSEAVSCKQDVPNVQIIIQMVAAHTVIKGRSTYNTKQSHAMIKQRTEILSISCIIHGPFVIPCSKLSKNKILHI